MNYALLAVLIKIFTHRFDALCFIVLQLKILQLYLSKFDFDHLVFSVAETSLKLRNIASPSVKCSHHALVYRKELLFMKPGSHDIAVKLVGEASTGIRSSVLVPELQEDY